MKVSIRFGLKRLMTSFLFVNPKKKFRFESLIYQFTSKRILLWRNNLSKKQKQVTCCWYLLKTVSPIFKSLLLIVNSIMWRWLLDTKINWKYLRQMRMTVFRYTTGNNTSKPSKITADLLGEDLISQISTNMRINLNNW